MSSGPEQVAAKLKANYLSTLASANNIVTVVKTNASWRPFQDQLAGMEAARLALDEKIASNDFFAEFLIHDKQASRSARYFFP